MHVIKNFILRFDPYYFENVKIGYYLFKYTSSITFQNFCNEKIADLLIHFSKKKRLSKFSLLS